MSVHLPGLIDRYVNVPPAYRSAEGRRGRDRRRAAGRRPARPAGDALAEISEKLARSDLAAFETQGRFIKSRYGEERIDG